MWVRGLCDVGERGGCEGCVMWVRGLCDVGERAV